MDVDLDKLAAELTDRAFVKFAEEGDEEDAVPAPENEGGGSNWGRWLKGLALGGGVALGSGLGIWAANKYAPQLAAGGKAVEDAGSNILAGRSPSATPPKSWTDPITPGNVGGAVGAATFLSRNPVTNQLSAGRMGKPPQVEHAGQVESPTSGRRLVNAMSRFGLGPGTEAQNQSKAITRSMEQDNQGHDLISTVKGLFRNPTDAGKGNFQAASDYFGRSAGTPAGGEKGKEAPGSAVMQKVKNMITSLESKGPHPLNAVNTGAYFAHPETGEPTRPGNLPAGMTAQQIAALPVYLKTIVPDAVTGKSSFQMQPVTPGQPLPGTPLEHQVNLARTNDVDTHLPAETKLHMAQGNITNAPETMKVYNTLKAALPTITNRDEAFSTKLKMAILENDLRNIDTQHAAFTGREIPTGNNKEPLQVVFNRLSDAAQAHQAVRRAGADMSGGSQINAQNFRRAAGRAGVNAGLAYGATAAAPYLIPQSWRDWISQRNAQPEVVK